MKIVVCVKQTPSTTAVFSVNGGKVSWDDPGGKPLVVNPWDEYAVEAAIQLQEEHGGDAIALSMGTEESLEALKTCLAGLHRGNPGQRRHFSRCRYAGTARVLAAAIEKIGDVQMIAFFGKQAIDGILATHAVQVAVKLGGFDLRSAIKEIDAGGGTIT